MAAAAWDTHDAADDSVQWGGSPYKPLATFSDGERRAHVVAEKDHLVLLVENEHGVCWQSFYWFPQAIQAANSALDRKKTKQA